MRYAQFCLITLLAGVLAFLSACGGGGGSSSGSTPNFTLAVTPSSQSAAAGSPANYSVQVTPVNGFTGAVTLAANGLPAGATASFSAISGGVSTLTVSTTSTTPVATSMLTITGSSGALTHSVTASLAVSAAPDFSISTTPSNSVTAGGSASYNVTVTALNGFTGTVIFSGSSLPTGANAWFLPTSVSGNGTSVLTVTTPSTLAASTYSFSISGISNGVTHSASSSLTVTAPTGSFSLSGSPFQQTVMAGGATGYQVILTPASGFTQNVTLSASSLPNGTTGVFTPSTITGGSGTSTLVVTTASSAPVCCARISVAGTAGSQTAALTLPLAIITAAPNQINKVFVIAMQGQDWATVKGNAAAPYINNVLLAIGSHAEQYYNPTGIQPDLPNYLWLEAGENFGVADNNAPATNSQASTSHLVTMLMAAGKNWKSYNEDIDGTTCPLTDVNQYAVFSNPFVYFDDITNTNSTSSATCIAHVRPFSELSSDLQNNTVADYTFITPSQIDNMSASSSVALGDTWLAANLPTILNSPAYQSGGVVFITWDQPATPGAPVGMIVLSPNAKGGGYSSSVHYTHGSTLRSVQEIFGLTPMLGDAANQVDLSDLFVTFP